MTLNVQVMTMLVMTAGGIYLGFALETYRRLTRNLLKWPVFVYVLESLFWMIQTIILFILLYNVNYGELRFYVILACLLGYSIYQVVCKHIYQKLLEKVIIAIKTIFGWFVQAFDALLIQPVLWVFRVLLRIGKFLWSLCRMLLHYPLKLLFFIGKKVLPEKFLKNISKFYVSCSTMVSKLVKGIRKTIGKWR